MPRRDLYSSAVEAIYRAAAAPEQWSSALESVADYVGGSCGAMLVHSLPVGQPSSMIVVRMRDDLTKLHLERHIWNPWSKRMARVPFEKAVSANSLVDRDLVRKTEFDADMLAPQSIEDMLAISHKSMTRSGGVGGPGIALSSRGAERVTEAVRRLDRLQPHFSRALEFSLVLAEKDETSRQLKNILDLLPNAVVLLGPKGQVLHANRPAETLLRDGDGITVESNSGGRLKASDSSDDRLLKRQIAEALAVAAGGDSILSGALRLGRQSGRPPLLVLVSPLPPAEFEVWHMPTATRLLVFINDPTAAVPSAARVLCTAFGLTAAEARVTLMIGAGYAAPQVAQSLGVALPTVKTQLAHAYDKIGIHSQVAVARLLATLPNCSTKSNNSLVHPRERRLSTERVKSRPD
jgi:DNA-binding CsgD family transcriptional regulator